MKKELSLVAAVATAFSCIAAPIVDQPAEGYQAWEGFLPKNQLWGRALSPSDMRHRAILYIVVDYASLDYGKLADFYSTFALMSAFTTPANWDTFEMPRSKLTVFAVKNAEKIDVKTFSELFNAPKTADDMQRNVISRAFWSNRMPFYKSGLKPVGFEEPTADKLPYIAVYGGSGTSPIYTKAKFSKADIKAIKEAYAKAVKGLSPSPSEWKKPLGVAEVAYFKTVPTLLEKGKPATAVLPTLQAGLKSKVPEQAKEAQIMFDALNQYRGELILRIKLEASAAPARAYFDLQQLTALFPSEKKNVEAVASRLKSNKEITSLGKMFEKAMTWSKPDYVCKNTSEMKKNVAELEKFKKMLESLVESKSVAVQGEALMLQSQIDALIETMPTKLPQK